MTITFVAVLIVTIGFTAAFVAAAGYVSKNTFLMVTGVAILMLLLGFIAIDAFFIYGCHRPDCYAP